MAIVLEQLKVERRVIVGRYTSGRDYRIALHNSGCAISRWLLSQIDLMEFPGERRVFELVSVCPVDLGLGPSDTAFKEALVQDRLFIKTAVEAGLEIPSLEVAFDILLSSPEPLEPGKDMAMYYASPFKETEVHEVFLSKEGGKSRPRISTIPMNALSEMHPSQPRLFVLPKT